MGFAMPMKKKNLPLIQIPGVYCRLVILVLLLLVALPGWPAQTIHVKNSAPITGTVLEDESSGDFLVVDIYSGVMSIPRKNVTRIEESSPYEESYARGMAGLQKRDWVNAALHFHNARQNAESNQLRNDAQLELHRAAEQLLAELKEGNPQDFSAELCQIGRAHV